MGDRQPLSKWCLCLLGLYKETMSTLNGTLKQAGNQGISVTWAYPSMLIIVLHCYILDQLKLQGWLPVQHIAVVKQWGDQDTSIIWRIPDLENKQQTYQMKLWKGLPDYSSHLLIEQNLWVQEDSHSLMVKWWVPSSIDSGEKMNLFVVYRTKTDIEDAFTACLIN